MSGWTRRADSRRSCRSPSDRADLNRIAHASVMSSPAKRMPPTGRGVLERHAGQVAIVVEAITGEMRSWVSCLADVGVPDHRARRVLGFAGIHGGEPQHDAIDSTAEARGGGVRQSRAPAPALPLMVNPGVRRRTPTPNRTSRSSSRSMREGEPGTTGVARLLERLERVSLDAKLLDDSA